MVFYNEFEPFAVNWIQNLSTSGLIPAGTIDRRSITEITPDDINGYTQAHFFAGIAGWAEAFRLAGIGPDVNAWSGSCPCQPFSSAGKQKGTADERHLWPVFHRLIDACRPPLVFGEQVSSAIGHGWLDGVFADMEGAGYTGWACVLGAHSAGAPHIRQRLFWGFVRNDRLSDTSVERIRAEGCCSDECSSRTMQGINGEREWIRPDAGAIGCEWLSDTRQVERGRNSTEQRPHSDKEAERCEETNHDQRCSSMLCQRLQHADEHGRSERRIAAEATRYGDSADAAGSGIRHSIDQGLQRHAGVDDGHESRWIDSDPGRSIASSGAWSDCTIGHFKDGKTRRIGRGVQPLAYGVPKGMGRGEPGLQRLLRRASKNRTGRLKGYGNAILPQVAAVFIRAFMEAIHDHP